MSVKQQLDKQEEEILANNPNELTIENSVRILIDHQPAIVMISPSLRPEVLVNNVAGLARAAKILGVPTVLTTVGASGKHSRGSHL